MPMPCAHCHTQPAIARVDDPAGVVLVKTCDCDRLRCPSCHRTVAEAGKSLVACPRCDELLPDWPTDIARARDLSELQ